MSSGPSTHLLCLRQCVTLSQRALLSRPARREEEGGAERTHPSFRSCIGQGPRTKRPETTRGHQTKDGTGGKTTVNFQATGCPGRGQETRRMPGPGAGERWLPTTRLRGRLRGEARLSSERRGTMQSDAVLPSSGALSVPQMPSCQAAGPSAPLSSHDRSGTVRAAAPGWAVPCCPLLQPRRTLTSRVPGVAQGLQKWGGLPGVGCGSQSYKADPGCGGGT